MRFTAIDFETANGFIGSICAVGLAIVEGGAVVDRKYWLIKPHREYRRFHPFNVAIHGITRDMVAGAEEFDAVYMREIAPILKDTVLAAHNAAFDMSALRHVLGLYHIEYPTVGYICTYKAAQKTWAGLENYKLDTISRRLRYRFVHHNALEDALACANILLTIGREKEIHSLDALAGDLGMRMGRLYRGGYQPCSIAGRNRGTRAPGIPPRTGGYDPNHGLYGMKVVFTGRLLGMSRRAAMQRVLDIGGIASDALTEDTDFLVMGMGEYLEFSDGQESNKTKRAKTLIDSGKRLQIIDEKEFMRMIG